MEKLMNMQPTIQQLRNDEIIMTTLHELQISLRPTDSSAPATTLPFCSCSISALLAFVSAETSSVRLLCSEAHECRSDDIFFQRPVPDTQKQQIQLHISNAMLWLCNVSNVML